MIVKRRNYPLCDVFALFIIICKVYGSLTLTRLVTIRSGLNELPISVPMQFRWQKEKRRKTTFDRVLIEAKV